MPARLTGLAAFQEKLGKEFGDIRAPQAPLPLEFIPTGSLTLDWALRRGGWPVGRIVELWGPPDTCKSTLTICSMREAQRKYPQRAVAYIDMEGTFDYDWAGVLGLDVSKERWQHLYPKHSEDASDMARQCCMSGFFSLVALDSIGGMESKKAFEDKKTGDVRNAEDDLVGKNAQVITRMVKHLASLAREKRTAILLVNQPRAVISSMGLPDQPSGPRAQQHATTTRVKTSRGKTPPLKLKIDGRDEIVSRQFMATVDRSKQIPVGRVADFWLNIQATVDRGPVGIDWLDECTSVGISTGAIIRNTSYYQIPTQPQVQGEAALIEQVRQNPALAEVIRKRIFELEEARGK